MSETLAVLSAQETPLAIRGTRHLAAAALDALATYEQSADICAAAMTAERDKAAEVDAAVESVPAAVAARTRRACARGQGRLH
jgi:hypothetical protein